MALTRWTGRRACALQAALRLSNELFAEHLGIGVRTVASWHEKPTRRPNSEMQQLLDTALERASEATKKRFAQATDGLASPNHLLVHGQPRSLDPNEHAGRAREADAERKLDTERYIEAALDWLDQNAGWAAGAARRAVVWELARLDVPELRDRNTRRRRIGQRRIAEGLANYYKDQVTGYGRYITRCDARVLVPTSILTTPDWLDLSCPLSGEHDRLVLSTPAVSDDEVPLDVQAAEHSVQRIAETLALGVRIVDMPIYRLMKVDIRRRLINGSVSLASFAQYALTVDLLEGELIDALANGVPTGRGSLPMRDRYLPDTKSVLDLPNRLCAGGVLALCAIARPASRRHDADYLVIVQERSGSVLNATRTLAVIPKGFHQPLTDVRADSRVGQTLEREMEEELFGREDVDGTMTELRSADPMHPSRLSEPMRWLTENPDALRMECTGFGLNLVSGNYEFASLVVVEDEDFWVRHGGQVEANWESSNLRRYSTLDGDLFTQLVQDVAWSNEGLFALSQGLRRLSRLGGRRVNLPTIEWEIW